MDEKFTVVDDIINRGYSTYKSFKKNILLYFGNGDNLTKQEEDEILFAFFEDIILISYLRIVLTNEEKDFDSIPCYSGDGLGEIITSLDLLTSDLIKKSGKRKAELSIIKNKLMNKIKELVEEEMIENKKTIA